MDIVKRWYIEKVGWDHYFDEVAAISHGRTDLQIVCMQPGVINLIKKEQQ